MSFYSPKMEKDEKLYEMAINFGLQDEQARIYVDVFQCVDQNKDGRISAEELNKVLNELGFQSTLEQTNDMVAAVDENSDGMVDFNEFLHMMDRTAMVWQQSSEADEEEDILLAFKMFDINHDGKINFNELQQTMAKMGQPLTRKEALEMFKAMDENGDGVITFKEFMATWQQFVSECETDSSC